MLQSEGSDAEGFLEFDRALDERIKREDQEEKRKGEAQQTEKGRRGERR